MTKKRIAANFYTIGSYRYNHNTDSFDWCGLPNNRLYSGWGTQHPTTITVDDLPEWYVLTTSYKKNGYLNTKGIKSAYYINSPFNNHWLKDSTLIISYVNDHLNIPAPKYPEYSRHQSDWYDVCKWGNDNLYVFGSDILVALKGLKIYSPDIDTKDIEENIIYDYNAYTDDRNKWVRPERGEQPEPHIDSLNEIMKHVHLR